MRALLRVVVITLTGCAVPLNPAAMQIRDATDETVRGCKFVGRVKGTSGWGNKVSDVGIENSKNEARTKAAKLGATHIVWRSMSGQFSSFAEGEAFKCKSSME
jgi:hypothetical protein